MDVYGELRAGVRGSMGHRTKGLVCRFKEWLMEAGIMGRSEVRADISVANERAGGDRPRRASQLKTGR